MIADIVAFTTHTGGVFYRSECFGKIIELLAIFLITLQIQPF